MGENMLKTSLKSTGKENQIIAYTQENAKGITIAKGDPKQTYYDHTKWMIAFGQLTPETAAFIKKQLFPTKEDKK